MNSFPPTITDTSSLVAQLRAAQDAYTAGSPVMSDSAFDQLEQLLRDLDPDNPWFQVVGSAASQGFVKVRHAHLMGSLAKVQTEEEYQEWDGGHPGRKIGSEKLDGLSCRLEYQEGRLVLAATRGDGQLGEDITSNAQRVPGIPSTLGGVWAGRSAVLRGEILCTKSALKQHFPSYSNCRNTAAGVMKRLDGQGAEHLLFRAYQIFDYPGTKEQEFETLQNMGFWTPLWFVADTSDTVLRLYRVYQESRKDLDYDIDGLVLEIADPVERARHGYASNRPGGAVALKFPHDTGVTTLRNILWQTGSAGHVTPVAVFDPLPLAGAMVERATLSNVSKAQQLGLRVGDLIEVSRRNDVIPKVEANLTRGRSLTTTDLDESLPVPTACPSCGFTLEYEGKFLACPNGVACTAQLAGAIQRWTQGLDIKGWGEVAAEALVTQGLVARFPDIYRLTQEVLAELSLEGRRLGASKATTMLQNLRAVQEVPLARLVGLLGIPYCSVSTIQSFVDAGYGLDQLLRVTTEQALQIHGVGKRRSHELVEGIHANQQLIQELLQFVSPEKPPVGNMTGKTICLTDFRDPALQRAFEQAGGQVRSSVVKDLTWLVTPNQDSSSEKAKKARLLGIEILSPLQLRDRIAGIS